MNISLFSNLGNTYSAAAEGKAGEYGILIVSKSWFYKRWI